MSRILNIRTVHKQIFGKYLRPKSDTLRQAYEKAIDAGIRFGADGRAYAPWRANAKGMRWQKGQLIPRFQK